MKINKSDIAIKKITVTYSDGTTKEIDKGAVIETNETDDGMKMDIEFCKFSGNDLINMIYGILDFAGNSGMLDDMEEDENND